MAIDEKVFKVSLFQGSTMLGDKAGNIEKMMEVIKEASLQGSNLVIFPEMFLTGYFLSVEDIKRL